MSDLVGTDEFMHDIDTHKAKPVRERTYKGGEGWEAKGSGDGKGDEREGGAMREEGKGGGYASLLLGDERPRRDRGTRIFSGSWHYVKQCTLAQQRPNVVGPTPYQCFK